jgi:hypothetical protein
MRWGIRFSELKRYVYLKVAISMAIGAFGPRQNGADSCKKANQAAPRERFAGFFPIVPQGQNDLLGGCAKRAKAAF